MTPASQGQESRTMDGGLLNGTGSGKDSPAGADAIEMMLYCSIKIAASADYYAFTLRAIDQDLAKPIPREEFTKFEPDKLQPRYYGNRASFNPIDIWKGREV